MQSCAGCANLDPTSLTPIHHIWQASYQQVVAGVARECQSCRHLSEAIERCVGAIQQQQNACGTLHVAHPPDGGSPVQISSVRLYYRVETDTVEIEVQTDAGQPPISIELFSLKGSDCPFPKLPSNRKRTPGDTGCDQTFDQIQAWLTECVGSHPRCTSTRQELPTRLIEIAGADYIRLVESLEQTAPYAALSHCWGPNQIITTTTKNIEAHKRCIALSALSNTFRDAIDITQRLGVKFIWIDSLCIVQDSRSDWEYEAARMASVYTNALFTISAVKSASGDGGCFSTNPEEYTSGVSPGGLPYTLVARRRIEHWAVKHTPLLTRGWVFQERILSPRVVHFGQQEVFWECLSNTTCQCIGIEDASTERQEIQESDIGAKKHKYTAFLSNFVTNNASTDSQQHNNSIMWQSMVRDFSELKLTIPTDRLPALDGLRSRFGDLKDAKYFHGLWQDTIHSDMLWFQSDSRSAHISINVPTWSWARVGGMVNFFEYDYTTRGNWDRKKIERLFGCLDDKVPDGQLRLTWRTPYDLIPAHLEYVQPQNRRQSTDIGTGVLSSSRECDSVSPTREIQTGTNVQDASSVDGPLDNNPTSSDQASSYTLPSGPSSIRSEDDDASIDNPGFHNSSTYLSFFVKHVCTKCEGSGTGATNISEAAEIDTQDSTDHASSLDAVRCVLCADTGYVHENTMALNYVSNFFEDWNMRESRDKLAPGSVVSCLLLAEASSNTWLFIVLHDLSNGTFRRIGALEVYTIDDPSLAETGPVQAPFPFEQLNEDKVIVIV